MIVVNAMNAMRPVNDMSIMSTSTMISIWLGIEDPSDSAAAKRVAALF
ncbi:MAG: hypothetical protein ABFD92_07490 [Planctomycetaceae bacterium]|nr:hypothetical protein [Planctomycetaceae bacterium]